MKIAQAVVLMSIAAALAAGCASEKAEIGDRVKVGYVGKLEDGTVFDSSATGSGIEFVVGDRQMIPGFENAVLGMEVGARKSITISPDEAYGPHRPELTHTYPADSIPPDINPEVGMTLSSQAPDGRIMQMTITDIDSAGNITVDANHPLAGKTLIFDLTLVEIMEDTNQN